jgi:hypothetical protein
MAKKPLTARSDKEAALEAMKADLSLKQSDKEFHRYNIEIPTELFEEIRGFIKEHGYNLKGFFLTAAKEKIRKEKQSD